MVQPKVTLDVRNRGKVSVVDIRGELTGAAENDLMAAYTEATRGNTRAVVLNFGHLEYMNSTGIGLLVTLLIRANRQGERLLATGLNDHYRSIFELTRLNEAIHIYDAEAEAIAAVGA